jgi:PST family polysaccharide transporter
MTYFGRLTTTIRRGLNNRFIRNVGWLGGSDLFIRISYLATTVVLARLLTKTDYGMVAIITTVSELMFVFTRVGIGLKLIQADAEAENFDDLCNSAYWLNWVVFLGLFVAQCLIAFPVSWFYPETQGKLVLPICVLALSYLIIPIASTQASLTVKENRLKVMALSNSVQLTFNNLVSIAFAFLGMGIWAVILPKVLGTPIWVYMFYTNHSWRPSKPFTTKYWGDFLKFGKNILGVQLLKTLRNNLDYLIVGRFIGLEGLGLYYFAFNAGLGISLSIINGINASLYPHLCEVRDNWSKFQQQYFKSLKAIALILVPVVLTQSLLAPFYVPIIFGQKWVAGIPILILICLSAIPRPFADAASSLLTAVDRPQIDLYWNVIFTILFVLCLLVSVQWQIRGVAIAVLLTHWIFLPAYSLWASRYVFSRLQPKPNV